MSRKCERCGLELAHGLCFACEPPVTELLPTLKGGDYMTYMTYTTTTQKWEGTEAFAKAIQEAKELTIRRQAEIDAALKASLDAQEKHREKMLSELVIYDEECTINSVEWDRMMAAMQLYQDRQLKKITDSLCIPEKLFTEPTGYNYASSLSSFGAVEMDPRMLIRVVDGFSPQREAATRANLIADLEAVLFTEQERWFAQSMVYRDVAAFVFYELAMAMKGERNRAKRIARWLKRKTRRLIALHKGER